MTQLPYEGATPEQLRSPLVNELLAVHNMFRTQLDAILGFTNDLLAGQQDLNGPETQRQIQSLVRAGQQYTYYLHFHHHHETDNLFPVLEADGLDTAVIDRLNADHDELGAMIDEFSAAIRQFSSINPEVMNNDLRRLADALQAHLAYEETHICPFLARMSGWPM